ncbi:MAG: PBP1A family penicillin-binding protein [Candidatus Levybacteria bacterium]|nr:PBP1A family penicillin-binding protein [Candidatus Levybacteria bacterium]
MFTKKQYSKASMKQKKRILYPFRVLIKVIKKPSLLFRNKFLLIAYFLLAIPVIGIAAAVILVLKDVPKATVIGRNNFPQSSKLYAKDGTLLYTIYASKNQSFVSLQKIPKNLQHATIAIEDKNFYKHGAVDVRGIARAVFVNLSGNSVQGGSTITQQLVRNSLLTLERTLTRKIKEVILSFVVEFIYSKDRILEMYLNQVSYGGTAWGVEAASQIYFGKDVSKLSLAESAFLAGLPQAPSVYSPFGSHPEDGKKRQLTVLQSMKDAGYITADQQKKAAEDTLTFSQIQDNIVAPHFVFYIKDLLVQEYGEKMVEQGGLSVITSLDLDVQKLSEDALASEEATLRGNNWYNAATVVTRPGTGELLAMVGSRNYFDTQRDGNVNVTISKRQPGSSIKPINYATGLIKGYTAATPFVDERKCFPNPSGAAYCPMNYDQKFHGVQQMRYALANSFNIPAVKMLKLNGLEAMIATASAMGINSFTDPSRYGLSLTLGGGEVTMLEMVQAYGVFANNGYKINLHPILKVTDSKGKVLSEYKPVESPLLGQKVLPEGVAFIISNILSDNGARSASFGSNSPLFIKGFTPAVKTGTTNDYRDNWTIGYTPSYVVATWVGNNDNKPLRGVVSGVTGAAPIWNQIMQNLIKDKPPESFRRPDSVVGATICATSGLLPQPAGSPYVCPTRYEYFIKGTVPRIVEPGIKKVFIDKETGQIAPPGKTDNVEEVERAMVTDPTGDSYCTSCPRVDVTPTPNP